LCGILNLIDREDEFSLLKLEKIFYDKSGDNVNYEMNKNVWFLLADNGQFWIDKCIEYAINNLKIYSLMVLLKIPIGDDNHSKLEYININNNSNFVEWNGDNESRFINMVNYLISLEKNHLDNPKNIERIINDVIATYSGPFSLSLLQIIVRKFSHDWTTFINKNDVMVLIDNLLNKQNEVFNDLIKYLITFLVDHENNNDRLVKLCLINNNYNILKDCYEKKIKNKDKLYHGIDLNEIVAIVDNYNILMHFVELNNISIHQLISILDKCVLEHKYGVVQMLVKIIDKMIDNDDFSALINKNRHQFELIDYIEKYEDGKIIGFRLMN
jgi:hypothetical protein